MPLAMALTAFKLFPENNVFFSGSSRTLQESVGRKLPLMNKPQYRYMG
jgi:hypothetical protein